MAFVMKIRASRDVIEERLNAPTQSVGFLIAQAFEIALDIRELLIGLHMQQGGLEERSSNGVVLP